MKLLPPMPRCRTCRKPCKRRERNGVPTKFCTLACVPKSSRQQGGRKSGRQRELRSRLRKFQAELARLRALPTITGEDLLASFQTICEAGYQWGYGACEAKWLYREKQKGAAA